MLIALNQIADHADHLRRAAPTAEQDAGLLASVRELGILQPIIVQRVDGGFEIVAGRRRLQAARTIGLTEIPAEIRDIANGDAPAIEAAENLVRAAMNPVDQWRAIVALQQHGRTLNQAAAALGLPDRLARRLDKLGRLHPDMLDAVERHGMPAAGDLAMIVSAPLQVQQRAAKNRAKPGFAWREVMPACTVTRIPRSVAIFDVDAGKIAFEEDLFAEPGSDKQFTTTDVKGFLKAQQAALVQRVNAGKQKGEAITLAEWDITCGCPLVPKQWRQTYDTPKGKFKDGGRFMQFVAVRESGYAIGAIYELYAEKVETAAKQKARAKAAASQGDAAASATPAAPKPGITKAGIDLLAKAKTDALRARLRAGNLSMRHAIACLVLLLGARNVDIRGSELRDYGSASYRNRDLAARLIGPGGDLELLNEQDMAAIAGEALARALSIDAADAEKSTVKPGSGPVADWIGAALGAADHLPRLDTAEILAAVNAGELRAAAEAAGMKPAKTAVGLREQLTGKVPDWRPTAAQFGAPGPIARSAEDDEDDA